MTTTQDSLNIDDIAENIVLLKDGGGALVLKTGAVNFGLLSEVEQFSIIQTFAQMLNSLSFAIQIVIHSERLDISSYLKLLDNARVAQTNPLLSGLIVKYRLFIQSTIKENDVLDKQFFVVIPLSPLEIGLGNYKKTDRILKIKTMLTPRKDQLVRQLTRVGLKSEQLNNDQLLKLFYNIYNQTSNIVQLETKAEILPLVEPVRLSQPQTPAPAPASPNRGEPALTPPPSVSAPSILDSKSPPDFSPQWQVSRPARNHPFVVEELI